MSERMPFTREEGGFTTPAAALAILVVCALVFVCTRSVAIGSRSGQIQYVADAGALAADNVVAEFVTVGQAVDAAALSLSLLGLSTYAVSAVAAFIPGAQGAATSIASAGSKILSARDKFVDAATRGLDAAQKALPALCALRASQAVQANANASGIPYAGIAIASPMRGADISLADGAELEAAAHDIESREDEIQQLSVRQSEAERRKDDAKRRAWLADCGNDGMSMYERAGHLSSISGARNPYYSSPDSWSFSVALNRALAYYKARHAAEPGENASGSPELIGQSVARKHFYAYACEEVSHGYVATSASGSELPHLPQLARNAAQIRETSLCTDARYPLSTHEDGTYLHAYFLCPMLSEGTPAGVGAVCDIDSGAFKRCPECKFDATTLGRVPSASTSISNGFEYHYLSVVEASREYAEAVESAEEAESQLRDARDDIAGKLAGAVQSLAGKRYDPQPPGRYGCVCIVVAPSSQAARLPFVQDDASLPARIAISGASLAPDAASDEGNVISGIAEGLVPQESMLSGPAKLAFGAWRDMLDAYAQGTDGIKSAFRKILGAIPVVGTSLSDQAARAFEDALCSAGIKPADLSTYKPVLVNTSHILERDDSKLSEVIGHLKQNAHMYGTLSAGDFETLVDELQSVPEVSEFLDDRGLEIATIPLVELGLGGSDGKLFLPVPKDLAARIEEARALFSSALAG